MQYQDNTRLIFRHARHVASQRAFETLEENMVRAVTKTKAMAAHCSSLAILLSKEKEAHRSLQTLRGSFQHESRNLQQQLRLLSEENDKLKALVAKQRARNADINGRYYEVWEMYKKKRDGYLKRKWKRFRQALSSLRRTRQ